MELRPAPDGPARVAPSGGDAVRGRLRSIRWQIVAAIGGASLLAAALLLPFARGRIEASFHGFEAAHARQEAHRLDALLAEQARMLERTALDYSRWDEAVEFIARPTAAWAEENLAQDVLDNFDAEMIAVADARLDVVAARVSSAPHLQADARGSGVDRALCRAAMSALAPRHRFEVRHGVAHLVVCSPVYSPQKPETMAGAMMWAAELSGRRIDAIRDLTSFDFVLQPGRAQVDGAMRFDERTIRMSMPVRDSDGANGLIAELAVPRPLGAQRALISHMVLLLLATALAVPPLLALILLDVLVVRRIRGMSDWVRALRSAGPVDLPRYVAAMTPRRAGFSELQLLGRDVSALAIHLDAVRANWQQQALRDHLTGLPNRACLIADVDRHFAHGGGALALLVVDLDGFKAINDMLGHAVGDEMLAEAARRFRAILPEHARPYRLGGDEFAVVATPSSREDVESLARLLAAELRFVRHANGRPVSVSASTGAALSSDDSTSRSVSALLTEADAAMYEAKRTGRGMWRRTSPAVRSRQREQIEVASALRDALAAGRLQAWFQPIVQARGGALVAVEALARWDEPGWGPVSPQRFIPAAERSGQILALDLAVLDAALAPFIALRVHRPALRLHVNVSAQSLADPAYAEGFAARLTRHALGGDALVLELTESDLAAEHVQMEASLRQLRALGVGLSVDDFGVGASSLARIGLLEPDCIKIDGSFVRDLAGSGGAICRVVVELARELGMECIAEYVETDEQAGMLAAMGCDALQGYGPGKPEPAEAFAARIVAGTSEGHAPASTVPA